MSWDIFVQDLPREAATVQDIPDDFRPAVIGKRAEIIRRIQEIVPFVDFADPSWGTIVGDDFSIELNMGTAEDVSGFAFHVRGSDTAAAVVAEILTHLNLRAINGFNPEHAVECLRR